MKTFKTVKTIGNLLFACQDNLTKKFVVVTSISKVCAFSENDPSTRQRYHCNNIVFKIVPLWRPFSVKTMIVFDRF